VINDFQKAQPARFVGGGTSRIVATEEGFGEESSCASFHRHSAGPTQQRVGRDSEDL
jgi:hypothetical protein